ncbi:MAG: hypothetical protein V3V08_06895 [Nannocystaceae bacterium]
MFPALAFLLLGGAAAFGLFRLVRSDAAGRRYLQAAADEALPSAAHLSPAMRTLAADTRTLRLVLEGTTRQLARGPYALFGRWGPWLVDLNRQLGEWLDSVHGSDHEDPIAIPCVVDSHRTIGRAFAGGSWGAMEGTPPAPEAVRHRLNIVVKALGQIEHALVERVDPYR